jgi:prevent-host-death family protein
VSTVSIKEAKNRLTELVRRAEGGDTVVITRHGEPVVEIVAHRPKGGLNLEAGREYLRKQGVTQLVSYIADDFDEPLPEDFLITPLPD